MARCKVGCIEILDGATNREKWDYVRSFFIKYPDPDPRDVSDPARIADENRLDGLYTTDLANWQQYNTDTNSSVPFERWLQWKWTYNTEMYGNLPQYRAFEHTGKVYAPCPYDTSCPEERTRILLDLGLSNPLPAQTIHEIGDRHYYMIETRNGRWGYQCTFDNCPYYISTGQRFFYV